MDQRRRTWLTRLVIGVVAPLTLIQGTMGQESARRVIQVKIEKRKVVAPPGAIRVTENEAVELRWSSDEFVKLHLHGYDKELKLQPRKPASMYITARATGRFPITSHGWGQRGHGHHALTYLEVHPR